MKIIKKSDRCATDKTVEVEPTFLGERGPQCGCCDMDCDCIPPEK